MGEGPSGWLVAVACDGGTGEGTPGAAMQAALTMVSTTRTENVRELNIDLLLGYRVSGDASSQRLGFVGYYRLCAALIKAGCLLGYPPI